MEDVAPDENTAGNNAAEKKLSSAPDPEEKLLPPGTVVPRGSRPAAATPPPPAPTPAPEVLASIPLSQFNDMPSGVTLPEVKPEDEESDKKTPAEITVPDGVVVPETAPAQAKNPAMLRAMNMLYGGNAVVAAQEKSASEPTPPPAPEVIGPGSEPFERNLREVGLKEALPHQSGKAPERVSALEKTDEGGLPRIRTYAEDMGVEIQKRGATISSIVNAEKARTDAPPKIEKPSRVRPNLFAIGSLLLVCIGIGIVVAAYVLTRPPAISPLAEGIIPVNERATVAVPAGGTLADTLAKERMNTTIPLGDVESIDITKDGTSLSAYDILTALGAPNELARNATGIMVGIHAFDHAQPFMLISVSAYDRAFAAMLDWEKTIGDTLGAFFAPIGGQTRAPVLVFTDRIIANLDARDSGTTWHIVYVFPQQNLILLTTNENTLREILSRLAVGKSSSN